MLKGGVSHETPPLFIVLGTNHKVFDTCVKADLVRKY